MTKLNQILDEDEILITFPIIDDVIKAMGMQGDKQQKISESEVLTVAFISHRYFGGNYKATLSFLNSANQSLFNNLLSKSRFMRRLHRWFGLLPSLFHLVSELKRKISLSSLYFIDSFPVSVCENIRIRRCKLAKGEQYKAS